MITSALLVTDHSVDRPLGKCVCSYVLVAAVLSCKCEMSLHIRIKMMFEIDYSYVSASIS